MDEENAAQRGYTASMAESDFEQSSLTLGVDLLSCPGAATGARQDSTIPVTGGGRGREEGQGSCRERGVLSCCRELTSFRQGSSLGRHKAELSPACKM